MRKWRIDELPQLWNILLGEMSLVGPRPERRFYIDQVIARSPYYKYLLKSKTRTYQLGNGTVWLCRKCRRNDRTK